MDGLIAYVKMKFFQSQLDNQNQSLQNHINDLNNPHQVTKSEIGLGNVDNIQQAPLTDFQSHTANKSNPHSVTKSQVGLGNVDNVQQASLTDFQSHTSNKSNPHSVTKSQVGLGSVDNIQQATKSEFNSHTGNMNNPHGVTKSQVGLGSVDNLKQAPSTRKINTGPNLTGGGDLSADRTIDLVDSPNMTYPTALALDSPGDGYNMYIRAGIVGGTNYAIKATKLNTTSSYIPVLASAFTVDSLAKHKTKIEEWKGSMIDVLRTTKLYTYFKKNDPKFRRYGFVIGKGYRTPKQVLDKQNKGVEQYNGLAFSLKVSQELIQEVDSLKEEIKSLKEEIKTLKEGVKHD